MTSPDEDAARIAEVIQRYQLLDPDERRAVEDTYRAVAEHSGPALTVITDDMLAGIRDQAQRRGEQVVVFVGRDGFPLAAAARGLDPDFVAERTRTVALSRVVLEHALRDLEAHTDRDLGLPAAFRLGSAADPQRGGSYRHLTRYLHANGVPVGREGSAVALVDTSYKGTSQEMLAAAYPATEFTGHYAFFGAHPEDPHPGSKTGYALHRDPDPGRGFPVASTDLAGSALWAHFDAIAAIEDLHHGALAKPHQWAEGAPEQRGMRTDDLELRDLNPARLAAGFTDPTAREAAHDAALLAVGDVAAGAGRRRRSGDPQWRGELDVAAAGFAEQLRSWIAHSDPNARGGVDPRLGRVLDAFAHRLDRDAVHRVDAALTERGIDRGDPRARELWRELAVAAPAERERIVLTARDAQTWDAGSGTAGREATEPHTTGRATSGRDTAGRNAGERGGASTSGAQFEQAQGAGETRRGGPGAERGAGQDRQRDAGGPAAGHGQVRGEPGRERIARERGSSPDVENEAEAHRRRTRHEHTRADTERDRRQ